MSIGVANFPQHGLTGEESVHCADIALHVAKERGRNCTVIYSEELSRNDER